MNTKITACIAAAAFIAVASFCLFVSEDSSAEGTHQDLGSFTSGSNNRSDSSNLYTSIDSTISHMWSPDTIYVAVGSSVYLNKSNEAYFSSLTTGYGLTLSDGVVSGTISKAGTIELNQHVELESVVEDNLYTIVAVDAVFAPAVTEINITSATTKTVTAGDFFTMQLAADQPCNFYEISGSAASYLSVTPSGQISGDFPFSTSLNTYDLVVEAVYDGDSSVTSRATITFTVEPVEEDQIDFTNPGSITGISGGSLNYDADTNLPATFSEVSGTAASWLSINSTSGVVTGTFPTVSSKTTYTYTIRATSNSDSGNTATQTITIDVYPVAKITASTRSVSGTEGESITSVTLSGNLGMSFSRQSGSFPSGITMSSSGVISGTPTASGSYSVTVVGHTTEGPSQSPTVVITFDIDERESTLTISATCSKDLYTSGDSIRVDLSSSVPGTVWSISGTAAGFMTLSGDTVVGSAPYWGESAAILLVVKATTPGGQTATKNVYINVDPELSFTTVPTADCIITPVYDYGENGEPVITSSFFGEVSAASVDYEFPDVLAICGTFTGSGAETVTWYWGDGTSDTGNKVTHAYSEPGTYEVRVVASNDLGESEMTVTVTVGESGVDVVYWIVIVGLVCLVIYMLYRLVAGSDNRGSR